jgi:hypothetical protein
MFHVILFSLLLTVSSCNKNKNCPKGSHNEIGIINNSSTTINWRLFISDSVYELNGDPYDLIIAPNSHDKYGIRGETCWEEYFNTINNGYKYFLIFDNDTVKALGWSKISGTDRGLLKKIKVDLNYLERNNFTITYP